MPPKKRVLLIALPLAILVIGFLVYYFFFRTYSAFDITADNYRTLLKETNKTITDDDISSSTQNNLSFYRAYAAADQDNGTIKVVRVKYDDFLQIQHSSKTTYLKTVSNWKGPDFNKLQSCHISDYYMANNNLPTTSYQLKQIVDLLIVKESFVLKESRLKEGNDILIKETKDKFIIVQIVGSYSDNNLIALSISPYSKRK